MLLALFLCRGFFLHWHNKHIPTHAFDPEDLYYSNKVIKPKASFLQIISSSFKLWERKQAWGLSAEEDWWLWLWLSAEQWTVGGGHCYLLKSGVVFKRETHMHSHTEACTLTHSLTTKRNYPIFIPDFGSSHFLRIESSLTSNTTSLWVLPCSQASSLSCSPPVCYSSLLFVLLLLFVLAKEPGRETKAGRMKKGKGGMWRKPRRFLIDSRKRGGPNSRSLLLISASSDQHQP